MQRIPELTPLEVTCKQVIHALKMNVCNEVDKQCCMLQVVEMFVAVFCFLKDSSEVSQLLLDDFRSCQGYLFLSEFLLK